VRAEGNLVDDIGMHPHLVAATVYVNLGEELRTLEFIEEFIDDWNWKLILHRLVIQGTGVDTEAVSAIYFLH
jgi:hypothetical protein